MAVAGSVEWTQSLNSTNLFFQHLGSLKMEGGRFKVIKTIDLREFEGQIKLIEHEIIDFTHTCFENNCTLNREHGLVFQTEAKKLNHDLKTVYALLGKYRHQRSVNFIGSGLKYLFGTMDNDDEEYITEVLQNLGKRQDKLHDTMNGTVTLMNAMSKQWENLRENQEIQFKNFLSVKSLVQTHYNSLTKLEWEVDYRSFGSHIDNLIFSVQAQIEKLKTAILFLKSGVVDPYLVDGDELIKTLTYQRLNYQVTPKDVDLILGNRKPVAVFDGESHMIHVIFMIPIAKETSFNLYENLIIPKIVNSSTIILDNIPKYFAVSNDNLHYFTLESLDCFIVYELYICKNTIVYNFGFERECITDLFFQNVDSHCQYKKLKQKFDIHNILNSDMIMFSTAGISVQLTCANFTDIKNLTGSYLIQPPYNCSVNSTIFEFDNNEIQRESLLVNKIPIIACCSTFYQGSHSNKGDISSIVLKSLHDIRKVDTESLGKELAGWKSFRGIDFKGHIKVWHLTTTMIIIGLIVTVFIWTKFKNLFCNDNNNIVVSFNTAENRRSGYPSFGDM